MNSGQRRRKEYVARTVDDRIIKEGLCALATLKDFPDKRDSYAVMGGMATQSYLPTFCRRPTIDIDVLLGVPLGRSEFNDFVGSIRDYLQDNGYGVERFRKSMSFKLEATSPEDETILLEFSRFNKSSYPKETVERELGNSRRKVVEGTDTEYQVLAPEDIVAPKIGRLAFL